MTTDSDVLSEIGRVTRNEIDLVQFEDWFVGETWELDTPLIQRITGLLAENSGDVGDATVRKAFDRILERPTLTIALTFGSSGMASVVKAIASASRGSIIHPTEFRVPA